MKTIEEIKQIIIGWGVSLPFTVRLHLFGSLVNGNFDPLKSDVDILIEFLEESYVYHNELRLRESLWLHMNKKWEKYLTKKLGMKVHLTFHRNDNKYILKILNKGTLVIYNSKERADSR